MSERLLNSFMPQKTFIPPQKKNSGYAPVPDICMSLASDLVSLALVLASESEVIQVLGLIDA